MSHNSEPAPKRRRYLEGNYFDPCLFLMLDSKLIEVSGGAEWIFCPLEKAKSPILLPTELWEGGDGQCARPVHQDPLEGSVLWDAEEECFVAWYSCANRLMTPLSYTSRRTGRTFVNRQRAGSDYCLAKSRDGLHWDKPVVGSVPFGSSYSNNLIPPPGKPLLGEAIAGVLPNYLEEGPDLVASAYSAFPDPVYPYGITQMHSSDGVHWTPHFPPTLPLDGDAHRLMWDPRTQCYLCTTRSAQHSRIIQRLRDRGMAAQFVNKRHVALSRSRDLVHWTPMLDILEADLEDPGNVQLYSMYILPYGNLYIGFLEMFHMSENQTYGPLDIQLAFSYDLDNWHRADGRSEFLARGEMGTWDCSHVKLFANPPVEENGKLRFWYGGKDAEHWQLGNAGMGTATLRKDGFACWAAGQEGGVVTTVPLQLNWATWPMLNVDAMNGEVRMEILTEEGVPIEGCSFDDCVPISGDHLRAVVSFGQRRGTFIRHTGRVRFRFHLRNARLYAFTAPHTEVGSGRNEIGNLWL